MGAKAPGEPAKWTGPGRDAVSRAWPGLVSTAWRGLLSQLGLSPQAERGAFNPEAHHHRSTRSRRRTRVAKSSRRHPAFSTPSHPHISPSLSCFAVQPAACLPPLTTAAHPASLLRPQHAVITFTDTDLALRTSARPSQSIRIPLSPSGPWLLAVAGLLSQHTACVCRTTLLAYWINPYECSVTAVPPPAAVDEGADMRQTLSAA